MALSFQQKLTLENGNAVFYHEGKLQSGEDFHVLITVPGKNIESYFSYISTKEDFAVRELEGFGKILHCDTGSLNQVEIEEQVKKL